MNSHSKNHIEQVGEIANCLAANFVKPLYNCCTEKNYYVYIGILIEILDWAHEFYEEHHDKLGNWEALKRSGNNIDNTMPLQEFLVAWGNDRANKFFISYSKEYGYPFTSTDNKTSYHTNTTANTHTVTNGFNI